MYRPEEKEKKKKKTPPGKRQKKIYIYIYIKKTFIPLFLPSPGRGGGEEEILV